MMETICGWEFDLSKPVFMEHPNFKFWEVKLNSRNVSFRVGKIKDGEDTTSQEIDKDYSTIAIARASVIKKIQEKLTKGYHPKNATQKKDLQDKQKKNNNLKDNKKGGKNNKVFSGEYYEKGDEAVRLQTKDKRVKITRFDKGNQKYEIRHFDSSEEAVDFCFQEQNFLLSSGYQAKNSKFVYSFVDDNDQPDKKSKKKNEPSVAGSGTGLLSITKMTDDAMSHRSRNNSEAKSDRSYVDINDDGDDNSYVASKLGNPASGCIKVLLAQTWNNQVDPTGWVMSEKLDGVRCFWTGSVMFSRNGNRFFFPKFFTRGWPKSQLDGELFIDRGQFSKTLSAVRKNVPIDQQWKRVKYLVFDCPGVSKPFNERLKMMEKVIHEIDNPYLKVHAHRQCKSYEDMFHELDEVNKIQGEGLMLREPNSKYQNRRSKTLLKVKTFHDDEAEVIGFKPGTGRCLGMVGALKVRNTFGVQFEVGSGLTDADRRKPPKIGSKITYKYQQFNKDSGKPRFPTYMRKYDSI